MAHPEITIIGAGIGGLCCAIALSQRGFTVRVLEQADAIGEIGAGLQITPNGTAVLDALGMADRLREIGTFTDAVTLRNYRASETVIRLDLGRHRAAQSYLQIHRADLVEMLAQTARDAGIKIVFGQTVAGIADYAAGVTVTMEDGSVSEHPLVIDAGGLHSRLRANLNGDDAPFFTGQVAWRALVPGSVGIKPGVTVHMGPGRHVVTYALRDGSLTNIVAVEEKSDWTAEGWTHPGDPDALRAAFSGFAGPVTDILDQVNSVNVWGLFRHPVAANWHGHHSAILGDAAHPTLPFLAQGANLAIEDAWVLADCLASRPVESALALYQRRRRNRVIKVINAANANANNYHLRNPLIRSGAHTALRVIGAIAPGAMLNRFNWVYGHDVTGN